MPPPLHRPPARRPLRIRPSWSRVTAATRQWPALRAHGVTTMFTLSGAHVFPLYDAAVGGRGVGRGRRRSASGRAHGTDAAGGRAARADRRLRRRGTGQADADARAGGAHSRPGVTNGVSAVDVGEAQRQPAAGDRRAGARLPLGCRSPAGAGPATDPGAGDEGGPNRARRTRWVQRWTRRCAWLRRRTGDRCSSTSRWTCCSRRADARPAPRAQASGRARPGRSWPASPRCWPRRGSRCSSSVATSGWTGRRPRPGVSSRRPACRSSPTGWAAGSFRPAIRSWSPGLARRRSARPIWSSWPARRWTSGSATARSGASAAHAGARSCTWRTPSSSWPPHATLAGSAAGDLTAIFDGILARLPAAPGRVGLDREHSRRLPPRRRPRTPRTWTSDSDPIHPARIYGELVPRLADDAVVIGDGGDFVSLAGRFVEPKQPGWLAGSRPLRVPGHRAGLCDGRAPGPALVAGRAAAG